jgi:hypothetical protein
MIVGKDGRPVIHPEDFIRCPFCGEEAGFMVIPLYRVLLGRGTRSGNVGIVPSAESVVYCHKTFKLVPPEFFKTGELPIITTPAAPPPAEKEKPECGPGPSSPSSPPSSSPSSS